jgi:hypothetical protein
MRTMISVRAGRGGSGDFPPLLHGPSTEVSPYREHHPPSRDPCSCHCVGGADRSPSPARSSCRCGQPGAGSFRPRPGLAGAGGPSSRLRRSLRLALLPGDERRFDETLPRLPRMPAASDGVGDARKGHCDPADGRDRTSDQAEAHIRLATTRHPSGRGEPVRGLTGANRRLRRRDPHRRTGGLGLHRLRSCGPDEPTVEASQRRASACALPVASPTVSHDIHATPAYQSCSRVSVCSSEVLLGATRST